MNAPLAAVTSEQLRERLSIRVDGRVCRVVGLLVEGTCPGAAVGDLVDIARSDGTSVAAEVVGLRDRNVLMIGLGDLRGVASGARVSHLGVSADIPCSNALLGRVIDARGRVLDREAGPLGGEISPQPLHGLAPSPLERAGIDTPLHVGVRAIDGPLTLGYGQRMGIFAGAGVGKSRLMGTLARSASADINVIALVGERGREVGEFIADTLSPAARRKSVVIVATSDTSPLERVRAAYAAHSVAEYFASGGANVLLMMDSLTRFAMAGRELGLAVGEPPATRGYPPSVFAALPRLLERAGKFAHGGSITGLYTVLVEGDDLNDPVADAARSILDGHIVLSRDLAARGHYPAIDVLASVSRVSTAVLQPAHQQLGLSFRQLLADLAEARELASIGAYVKGASARLDRAVAREDAVDMFLRQGEDPFPFPQTMRAMAALVGEQ